MILAPAVRDYLAATRPAPDPVLAEMEAHAARDGIPVVEPPTGRLLHVLARAAGARRVVEVGTAIGVSTLYLARALPEDGRVVSFDIDAERHAAARSYLDRAGVGARVELRLEDARQGLRALEGPFDLALLDGVKAEYPDYLDAVLGLVRSGGSVAVDNVLMGGAVAAGRGEGQWSDAQVAAAREFNANLLGDPRLAATLTPVGDGVALAVRL